jgi:O-antigen/teichoic acid export membrane protein
VQRKFITNLGLLLLLNFLIKPFWIFGIDRTVQNTVSSEDYGLYFALFNFSMLFNILLDLGLTNYNNRNIAQNSHLLSKYFSGIVVFKLLLAFVYFIVTFTIGFISGYDSYRFYILLFLAINQFLISFILYLRSNVAGLQLFKVDSLLSVLDKTLMIAFCVVLLWGNLLQTPFTLMHFIYAQTLAYLITAIFVFIVVLFKAEKFTLKINIPFLWLIIKQTFPYAVLVLTMTFYYRMDVVMLDFMLDDGEKQAAIYAQPYRLMEAFNQIGVLFAGLLLPMFAFMIKKNEKVNELLQLSFSLLFIPAIVLAIMAFYFSIPIMESLYVSNIQEAAKILPILMCCFVAISTTYIYGTLLTANGNLLVLNKLAIGGLFLNLILNYFLIPDFQGYGSALASLITQSLIVIFQMIIVKKLFYLNLNFKYAVKLILFVALVILLVYGVEMLVSQLLFQLIFTIIFSLLLGVIIKLIDLKKIYITIINRAGNNFK